MRKIQAEVKTSRKNSDGKNELVLVGIIDINQYDSVSEAVSQLGEKVVLDLVNTQYSTNAKNKKRAEAKGPSKTFLKSKAMSELLLTPEGMQKLQAVAGDQAALDALLEAEAERMQQASIAALPVAADDEEEKE